MITNFYTAGFITRAPREAELAIALGIPSKLRRYPATKQPLSRNESETRAGGIAQRNPVLSFQHALRILVACST